MQLKDQFLDHGPYISALEHVNLIFSSCVFLAFINATCKIFLRLSDSAQMLEKCIFLSMSPIALWRCGNF